MTKYVCEGGKGCCKPCELDDFTGGIEPNEDGHCRFTGEPKKWTVAGLNTSSSPSLSNYDIAVLHNIIKERREVEKTEKRMDEAWRNE